MATQKKMSIAHIIKHLPSPFVDILKQLHEKFIITKAYLEKLRTKRAVFKAVSKTKKHIFLTLVTTFGVKKNQYSLEIDNSLTMEVLFD